jgi:hypothetical protein
METQSGYNSKYSRQERVIGNMTFNKDLKQMKK